VGKNCLWVRWVHGIYIRDGDFRQTSPKQDSTWYFRKLIKLRMKFAQGYNGGTWLPDKHVTYTIKSGYKWLQGTANEHPETNIVWGKYNIPK